MIKLLKKVLGKRVRYVETRPMADKDIDTALATHRDSPAMLAVNAVLDQHIVEVSTVAAMPSTRNSPPAAAAASGQLEILGELRDELARRAGVI